jgi:hypothetical protein
MPCLLYHGTPEERSLKRAEASRLSGGTADSGTPVYVTSYEIAMRDRKYLQVDPLYCPSRCFIAVGCYYFVLDKLSVLPSHLLYLQHTAWKYMIVDEGHRLKVYATWLHVCKCVLHILAPPERCSSLGFLE